MSTITTQPTAEHICPTHLVKLSHLLKGGIGYCGKCGLYVQSLNHPPVQLDGHVAAKRAAEAAKSTKRRRRAAA